MSTKTVVVGANQLVKLLLWNPNISYSTFSSISPVPRLFRNVCGKLSLVSLYTWYSYPCWVDIGAILCYNVTSSESFHLVEHILKIACSYDSDAFGVVVGLVPIGFTENCRALPRSHCEHITNLHNLQYFEICIASASQDSISQPFDIVARMCTRGLVRSWMDIPLCETNTFRHVNFGWSPDTHLLYSTEFRRLVVLVILNLRYKAESAIRVRKVCVYSWPLFCTRITNHFSEFLTKLPKSDHIARFCPSRSSSWGLYNVLRPKHT